MNISDNGIEFIKSVEGCRLTAYDDKQPNVTLNKNSKIIGTLTIGIGHTGSCSAIGIDKSVYIGMTITSAQAIKLFKSDVKKFEAIVDKALDVNLNQNEYDALVSHALNCGNINTIAGYLNAGDYDNVVEALLKPNTSGGEYMAGLAARRKKEQDLFKEPVYWYSDAEPAIGRKERKSSADIKCKYAKGTKLAILIKFSKFWLVSGKGLNGNTYRAWVLKEQISKNK